MESENNCNDLRTASFAVYLKTPADETFVKKLGDSTRYPPCSREDVHLPLGSVKITTRREGDVGVFGAEKYFDGNVRDSPLPRLTIEDYVKKGACKKETQLDRCASISKSMPTNTNASTKSGWNIHAALLRGFRKNPIQGQQNGFGFIRRGFFRRLGCNKSCCVEKSVHVREDHTPKHLPQQPVISCGRVQTKDGVQCSRFNRSSSTESRREDLFAFPILGNVSHKESEERRSQEDVGAKELGNEDPRHSIEVFGSGHKDKKKVDVVALNMERKLSILAWDAIPKPHCPKASPRSSIQNDDQESEASSDLFEIENISGTAGVAPLFPPHPPDGFSGYEPSETSIEWSVVTASAADFSAVSEYDEKEVREINSTMTTSTPSTRNRPSRGLLGCKSHRTVRVAETAMKTSEKSRTPPLDSAIQGGKSPGDQNKVP